VVVLEQRLTLPGPPELVWRLITDWERQGDWMLEAYDFVVTTPHREGVGVEAEATIRVGGIKTRDAVRVVAWDPPRHLAIEHLGWVRGRGDIRLEPDERGTDFRWREELVRPWGFAGAIGLWIFRPLLARTFRRDAGVLAKLVANADAT
jgi:uncharacterized protein YndB with AHSA1/START domain